MKKLIFLTAILYQLLVSCSVSRPVIFQQSEIDIQYFYDALGSYGDWVHNREYGYVWIPHTGSNFFPYATHGQWVLTNYGWTWVSDYDWGWAVFHYGRWDYDPNYGWFWFPGNEWAPAWVEWRYGDGYYGWAPMRPVSKLRPATLDDEIYRWMFMNEKDFGKSNQNRYYVNRRRNAEIIRSTNVLNAGNEYYSGPDPYKIENETGRKINQVPVRDSGNPGRRLSRKQLEIFRPRVKPGSPGERPSPEIITDIKDIRPMRDRNSSYQPGNEVPGDTMQEGQGRREVNPEKKRNDRADEVRRQYELKQSERQLQRQKAEQQQKEISREERRQNEANRDYQIRRSERLQKTDQQKKLLEKERNARDSVKSDTTRRRAREVTPSTRRR
ncbi:MAG TPA: DUF6600 domain-containing protein [Bacteroidales bacterium]|nr:DUF6600 domain-containing protein [Bacteroidales bacterium]